MRVFPRHWVEHGDTIGAIHLDRRGIEGEVQKIIHFLLFFVTTVVPMPTFFLNLIKLISDPTNCILLQLASSLTFLLLFGSILLLDDSLLHLSTLSVVSVSASTNQRHSTCHVQHQHHFQCSDPHFSVDCRGSSCQGRMRDLSNEIMFLKQVVVQ